MAMEERSYSCSGGARLQQLSDVELNDVEHPQFVNSSLSDDEDLGENNNSYSVPKPINIFPIPISNVVPPQIRPPPVPSSSTCFVANLLMSLKENNNNATTTQDVAVSKQSIQKTINKITSDGQREVLENIQRSDEKRSELVKLKESINSLQIQKKTLDEEYTGLVAKYAKKGSVLKDKLAQAQSTYKKGESRLNDKLEAKATLNEQLKRVKRKLEEVSREDAQLSEWTEEHGIIVHMKSKSSSNCPEKDEVVIEVLNVNPLKPEDRFHVLAESVTLHRFCIANVFPDFEEAFEVIERANESQDLVKFLRDCKKCWKRDCQRSFRLSDKLCESTKGQTTIVDQTMELFDSPS